MHKLGDVLTQEKIKRVLTTRRNLYNEMCIRDRNRIYAGRGKQNVIGHPVHSMIETDDHETRKGICRVLLQALYAKKRLHSKRCLLYTSRCV